MVGLLQEAGVMYVDGAEGGCVWILGPHGHREWELL